MNSLISGPAHAELRDAIQAGSLRYTYKGIPMCKDPFDLALYSLLLWREKPMTIVEIGSAYGGSAMWLRDQMLAMGIPGMVYSIDIEPPGWDGIPIRPGVQFIQGDARRLSQWWLDLNQFGEIQRPLLVIEDSSHEAATTLEVMCFFDQHLCSGEMIVIEDGSATELYPGRFPCGGPLVGVEAFMGGHNDYVQAVEYRDFFGENVTWNYNGYWRKR